MLFEKTAYLNDFPVNIRIFSVNEYPIHYHQDIEMVYVLKGKIRYKSGYCNYILKEGDVFTNNGHEIHAMYRTEEENVVAVIQINNMYFTQYFPDLYTSCYRTYSPKYDDKLEELRKMLLNMITDYLKRSFDYKNQCTNAMIEVVKYLNKYFNLFALKNNVIVYFDKDNPIIVERISRILNYLYQNYSNKITLENLAQKEHLSPYYLSHFIKDCTGLSFREFLGFARVEMSEINLLGSNDKINVIARDVGFSTTSYYKKNFLRWFARTPEEHRRIYQPLVKSMYRSEDIKIISTKSSLNIVRFCLSSFISQGNNASSISQLKLDINVNVNDKPILEIKHAIEMAVTLEDFDVMSYTLFDQLRNMHVNKVNLVSSGNDSYDRLLEFANLLKNKGFSVTVTSDNFLDEVSDYGNDSIAAPIHVFNTYLLSDQYYIPVKLRDQGDKNILLKGRPSILTSECIKKPSFYAYLLLSRLEGDLICWGKNYSVIRYNEKKPSYFIITYNYNDAIIRLCTSANSLHETNDVINAFNDEIDMNINLKLNSGKFSVFKYTLTKENSIFNYAAQMDFPINIHPLDGFSPLLFTSPKSDAYLDEANEYLYTNFSIRGAGIQVAIIQPTGVTNE